MKRTRIAICSYLPERQNWLSDPRCYEHNFTALCKGVKDGFNKDAYATPRISTYVIIRKKSKDIPALVKIDGSKSFGHCSFHSSFGRFEYNQEEHGAIIEAYSRKPIPDDVLTLRIRWIFARLFLQNVPPNLELKIGAFSGFDNRSIDQQPQFIRTESPEELFSYMMNEQDLPDKRNGADDPKLTFYKRIQAFVGKKIVVDSPSSPEFNIV